MSSVEQDLLLLFCTGLIVVVRAYQLVRKLWTYPLRHGPGYFLGVGVAPGFYDGAGAGWLKRYRSVVVAEHAVQAVGLVTILASGRWNLLPAWAGGGALLSLAVLFGFMAYARSKLGATPPARASVAIALEPRRLGGYMSWPVEALVLGILACSWLLLLTRADAQGRWLVPAMLTYAVVGLFPCKISLVRSSVPLPSERTTEHHQWFEAHRRYSLRVLDSMRWLLVAVLAGYAVQHGWPGAASVAWLRWLFVAVVIGVWLSLTSVLIRGGGRLDAMGRDLRPVASWSGPFRSVKWMTAGGWAWTAAYLGGLVLLLVLFRR